MASSKIKGITIEIGGDTTKLGKAIESSEKQSRSLQGELKQVEKLLKFDPGNTELLAQKQKILANAVKETADKLKILEQAQSQVVEQFNKGDIGEDQLRAFQREIVKTQNELNDFESELNGTKDGLKDVGDTAEQSGDGFTVMKGALADMVSNVIQSAISSIGDLVGSLLELSEATEEYRTMQAKLAGSAETFGYSVEYANDKYKEFYSYVGDDQMATNAITNLMGLGTSTDSVSALAESAIAVWSAYGDSIPIEALTESINETAQVGKVTGNLADALNWAGISEDEFNEKLEKCKNTQERADLIAKTLNGTYGESKKKYDELNQSVTDANEAELALKDTQAQLGETMAPVNTALTNLKNQALEAITPLVQKLADAFLNLLSWLKEHPTVLKVVTAVVIALASAFAVLATALAIQGLITGVTKAIAFLNTTLLANPIVLIIALITGLVAGFMYLWKNCDAFRNFWIKLFDKIKSVASTVTKALSNFFTVTIPKAFNKFKTKTSEVITAVVKWFKQLPGKISNAIKSAITNMSTWAKNMKTKATTGVKNVINSVVNWFKQLPGKIGTQLSKALTRVINWGKNIKTKAVNAVKSLVTSVTNWFKKLPGKIWSAIVGAVTRVGTWGSRVKNKAVSAIKSMVSGVVSTAKGIPSQIAGAISGAISNVASWGSNMLSTAKSWMSNVASGIVSAFAGIPGQMLSIGQSIISGVISGIGSMVGSLYESIRGALSGLVERAKSALGINSPSKVFANTVGKAIPEGVAKGVTDNTDLADDAVLSMTDDITDQALNLNGATINRKLNTTFNAGATTTPDNSGLLSKLDNIYDRLNRLQIVLDTGTLVGETIEKIDAGLANRQLLSSRGV